MRRIDVVIAGRLLRYREATWLQPKATSVSATFGIAKIGGFDEGARLSKRQQTPSPGCTRVVKLHSCN